MSAHRRPTLAAVALLLLGACNRSTPVRIGFVSGLSGRHSDIGVSSRNGALLAIEELNAAGGLDGRPVELVTRDDRHDPEAARRAVEELAASDVVAIIGNATSAMAEVTVPIVNRERLLMISPTASATTFQDRDDWFVLLYPSNQRSARALVAHLAAEGTARRVAAVLDLSNASFTRSWHEAFEAATVEAGGRVIRTVTFTSGSAPAWGALAEQALADAPDAVMLVANAFDTAALAQQLRKRSPGVLVLGTEWGFTSEALAQGGAAVEGAIFTLKVDVTSGTPRLERFRRAYLERYARTPDFAAILSAEAVAVIASGLRVARTREALRAEVVGRVHEGLQGEIRIDQEGDAERELYVVTVRDGRIARVR